MLSTFSTLGRDFVQETPHCAWTHHSHCEDPAHCNGSPKDYDFYLLAVSDPSIATDKGTSTKGLFYVGSLRADASLSDVAAFAQRIEDVQLELKLLIMINRDASPEDLARKIHDVMTGDLEVHISTEPLAPAGLEKIFAPAKRPNLPPA